MPPGTPTSLVTFSSANIVISTTVYFPYKVSGWFSLQSKTVLLNVSTMEYTYMLLIHSCLPVELQAHCQQDTEADLLAVKSMEFYKPNITILINSYLCNIRY
jgi:hypothetical protein